MHFLVTLVLLIAPLTFALPTTVVTETAVAIEDAAVEARACYVQCGSTCYTSAQASTARSAGFKYYQQGNEAGSTTYPHTYNNYEGFDFLVAGPYQEFPLKTSGAFTGGKLFERVEDGLVLTSGFRFSGCGSRYLQHCWSTGWRNYAYRGFWKQLCCLLWMVKSLVVRGMSGASGLNRYG
jgi:hypothetical protein